MTQTASELSINLSMVVYHDDGVTIAHCLELDIAAEGDNAQDAVQSLISLCDLQIMTALEEGGLHSIFRAAPPEIWEWFWEAATKMVLEGDRMRDYGEFRAPVDRLEIREMGAGTSGVHQALP